MDPRKGHPDFTPTEPPTARKRIFNVPLPPHVTIHEKPEPMPTPSKSMFPKAIEEASGVKVSISLFLLGAIAYGSYSLGNDRAVESAKIMEEVKELRQALKDQERTLTEARSECKNEVRSISSIESKISNIQQEIIVLNSNMKSHQGR